MISPGLQINHGLIFLKLLITQKHLFKPTTGLIKEIVDLKNLEIRSPL
jgi:hypothetical protein